jgi:Flp pilus assembly protein TadD
MGGQIDEAMSEWRISIRLRPDNPEARNNLGQGLAQTGHTKEAIEQFKEALRLRPNYPQALANLQNVLAR